MEKAIICARILTRIVPSILLHSNTLKRIRTQQRKHSPGSIRFRSGSILASPASAIQSLQTPYLNHDRLLLESTKGTPEYDAIDTLLKGVEVQLPAGSTFADKDGNLRDKIRVRWWLKPDPQRTIAETVFPLDSSLAAVPVTTTTNWEPYGSDQPPVIFGHYWLPKDWPIRPLTPNVICVDFSAGKGGR